MTNEEKELLMKDLCARLPYGVKIHGPKENDNILWELDYNMDIKKIVDDGWLPYLRPMWSMTEEEITEIYEVAKPYIIEEIKHGAESDNPDRKVEIMNGFLSNAVIVDELNKRHLDYRGLIPMGLALPAKEGMYNIE